MNLPDFTLNIMNLPEFTLIYLNLPEFTKIYQNLPEFQINNIICGFFSVKVSASQL